MRSEKDQIKLSGRIGFNGHEKKRKKRRKEKSGLVEDVSLLSHESYWKNDCKHRQELLKKKGQGMEAAVAMSGVDTEI